MLHSELIPNNQNFKSFRAMLIIFEPRDKAEIVYVISWMTKLNSKICIFRILTLETYLLLNGIQPDPLFLVKMFSKPENINRFQSVQANVSAVLFPVQSLTNIRADFGLSVPKICPVKIE